MSVKRKKYQDIDNALIAGWDQKSSAKAHVIEGFVSKRSGSVCVYGSKDILEAYQHETEPLQVENKEEPVLQNQPTTVSMFKQS